MTEGIFLFSERSRDTLLVIQLVEAWARADGWDSLDDCFEEGDEVVATYINYAEAVLTVIKQRMV